MKITLKVRGRDAEAMIYTDSIESICPPKDGAGGTAINLSSGRQIIVEEDYTIVRQRLLDIDDT